MGGYRFKDDLSVLRSPERVALLEVGRVVSLALEGIRAASVLDVGTGTGVFAEAFAAEALDVWGIDVVHAMLLHVRTYVPQGQFAQAVLEALPYQDQAFDLVFLSHVLHESPDPAGALCELRRVAQSRVVALEWFYREEPKGPPLAHRVKPERAIAWAQQAGFRKIEALSLDHMILYRLDL